MFCELWFSNLNFDIEHLTYMCSMYKLTNWHQYFVCHVIDEEFRRYIVKVAGDLRGDIWVDPQLLR